MVLHHAADQHAFAEAELLDHRAGHEGIGPLAGEVGGRVAEEAVAVGVHFEHARAGYQRERFAAVMTFRFVAIGNGPLRAPPSAARPSAATASIESVVTSVPVPSTATAAPTTRTSPSLGHLYHYPYVKLPNNRKRPSTETGLEPAANHVAAS